MNAKPENFNKSWTQLELKKVREMALDNKNAREIATALQRTEDSVYYVTSEYNIPLQRNKRMAMMKGGRLPAN